MRPGHIILYGFVYFMGMINGFLAAESVIDIVQNTLVFMIVLLFLEIIFTLIITKMESKE